MLCSLANRFGAYPLHFAIFFLALMKTVHGHEGDVRLVDPGKECNNKKGCGRVEVYHDHQWGSICNNYWDLDDVSVVCCQLGYAAALKAYNVTDAGTDVTWLDNVRCEGIESKLEECVFNGWGLYDCPENEYAAVECQVEAVYGDVRLFEEGKLQEYEGLVQLYNGKIWEDICVPDWGITESLVVCRQLGRAAATDFEPPSTSESGICDGTETNITKCNLMESECSKAQSPVRVTCSESIPDSLADALYNPDSFMLYTVDTLPPGGGNFVNMTLDVIRERTDGKCNSIPAEISCKAESEDRDESTCNRRFGFLCDPEKIDCQSYVINATCLRESRPEEPLCKNEADDFSYRAGETIRDDTREDCYARTCSSQGKWLSDYNENYCIRIGTGVHECARTCEVGDTRVCDFGVWNVEFFVAGSSDFCDKCLINAADLNATHSNDFTEPLCPQCLLVDGYTRMAAVVNRMIPGPRIEVCEGDQVIVKLKNKLIKDPTATVTIHWHGMFQRGTPYMDGTFMVTQCPIPNNEAFIYNFTAYPNGTHWWHSHAGLQYVDGVNGPVIVRLPKEKDRNGHEYDFDLSEHVIHLQDWYHVTLRNLVVPEFYLAKPDSYPPKAILINGRGGQSRCKIEEDKDAESQCKEDKDAECKVPRYAQFNVDRNKKYRFRVINAVATRKCALRVSIDNHTMTIIATDGAPTKPFTASSFTFYNAERYDFVLHTDQPSANYWLRVEGMTGKCSNINSFAIIHYDETDLGLPEDEHKKLEDPAVDPCNGPAMYNLASNATEAPTWNVNNPDKIFYLGLQRGEAISGMNLPRINNVTFCLPSVPFLLNNPLGRFETCNPENNTNGGVQLLDACGEGFCDCSHVLNVQLGSVVELVFVNVRTATCHPFHLHGTNYRVVAIGQLGDSISMQKVREMNENGRITKKLPDAIQKDTMVAPMNGYTVVQFRADNPGWWFFHCHYDLHLALGMAVAFHVDNFGRGESSAIPPIPSTFPRCGDWPIGRDSDGEAYLWGEETVGNLDPPSPGSFPIYGIAYKLFMQSKNYLRNVFSRDSRSLFSIYEVVRYRLRTDPVAGYHYFLLKIDAGPGCYIHLQMKMTTDAEKRDPVLQACEGCFGAETPLMPIKISGANNLCRPQKKCPVSSGYRFDPVSKLQLPALVMINYIIISVNV